MRDEGGENDRGREGQMTKRCGFREREKATASERERRENSVSVCF